jgi:hypothetical protein
MGKNWAASEFQIPIRAAYIVRLWFPSFILHVVGVAHHQCAASHSNKFAIQKIFCEIKNLIFRV